MRKLVAVPVVALGVVLLTGSSAFAHECINLNKPAGAGAQIVIDENGEVVWATNGLIKRFERGLIGEEGEGFHGIIGFGDADGNVFGSTYIVGPNGEIPIAAQQNGSPDHGIVNRCDAGLC
ncbi:MAG: hypothetical protein ACRD0C_01375 [Acidimicrobiia bacterium]